MNSVHCRLYLDGPRNSDNDRICDSHSFIDVRPVLRYKVLEIVNDKISIGMRLGSLSSGLALPYTEPNRH